MPRAVGRQVGNNLTCACELAPEVEGVSHRRAFVQGWQTGRRTAVDSPNRNIVSGCDATVVYLNVNQGLVGTGKVLAVVLQFIEEDTRDRRWTLRVSLEIWSYRCGSRHLGVDLDIRAHVMVEYRFCVSRIIGVGYTLGRAGKPALVESVVARIGRLLAG